jgi:hypothetical protein
MDVSKLTLTELERAMEQTPSIAILTMLRDEFHRFTSEEQKYLEKLYQQCRDEWNHTTNLKVHFGQFNIYWTADKVPYGKCSYSLKVDSSNIFHVQDKIDYLKRVYKYGQPNGLMDIENEDRSNYLFSQFLTNNSPVLTKSSINHIKVSSTSLWATVRDYSIYLGLSSSEKRMFIEQGIEAQDHKCALCDGAIFYDSKGNWPFQFMPVVDHDHKTGKIRGVLHAKCNTDLAVIENNGEEWIQKAKKYLGKK